MIGVVRESQRLVTNLRLQIGALKTDHVNREAEKSAVRGLVDGYFRTDRPTLLKHFGREDLLQVLDEPMQRLLRLTHNRTPKARYLAALKDLKNGWCDFELTAIPRCNDLTGGEVAVPTPAESAIIRALSNISPAAAACYTQALDDLQEARRRSWRGTATELREALREVLDQLAPDERVQAVPGFRLEPDAKGPTMKQKVRFIVKTRGQHISAAKPVEDATDYVEEKFGNVVRSVYSKSCSSVHATGGKEAVTSIKRFVDTVLSELLTPKGEENVDHLIAAVRHT